MISTIKEQYPLSQILWIPTLDLLLLGLSGYDGEGKITMWNISVTAKPYIEGEICDNGTAVHCLSQAISQEDVCIYGTFSNKRLEKYRIG